MQRTDTDMFSRPDNPLPLMITTVSYLAVYSLNLSLEQLTETNIQNLHRELQESLGSRTLALKRLLNKK